jgi:hypothetical protein
MLFLILKQKGAILKDLAAISGGFSFVKGGD